MEWKDCPREDLHMIPAMEAAGWTPEFSAVDKRYERTTADHPPHNAVAFCKGVLQAWICRDGWQLAKCENGRYANHAGNSFQKDGLFIDVFPETNGFIPSLKQLLEVDTSIICHFKSHI